MKKATFSNGFVDIYKGTRDVKAAWAMIRKSDGKVLCSGHSLDRQRAQKTAESHLQYHFNGDIGWTIRHANMFSVLSADAARKEQEGTVGDRLREEGLLQPGQFVGRNTLANYVKEYNYRIRERKLAAVTIEIIDL